MMALCLPFFKKLLLVCVFVVLVLCFQRNLVGCRDIAQETALPMDGIAQAGTLAAGAGARTL